MTEANSANSGDSDKSVIFTADDFGASTEVNAGILQAYRQGVLRGTSLMVAAPARDEAIAAARECPGLDVGLHLVVCQGRSVLPAVRLGALVDGSGRFVEKPVEGGMRYFFDRSLRASLADECRAQIELHLELVGYLNHIDGHLNFHVHPVICDILLDLASEYRVPCIRLPREPVFTTLKLARDNAARKLVEALIFRTLSRRTRRKMNQRGIKSTDWLFGLHQSGNLTEHYVLDVIARLPAGVTEIYGHPAASIGRGRPPEAAEREVEILTSPLLPLALEHAGARLTNFAELARIGR